MNLWIAPVVGVVALLVALFYANRVNKVEVGTERMKEIASLRVFLVFAHALEAELGFSLSRTPPMASGFAKG